MDRYHVNQVYPITITDDCKKVSKYKKSIIMT